MATASRIAHRFSDASRKAITMSKTIAQRDGAMEKSRFARARGRVKPAGMQVNLRFHGIRRTAEDVEYVRRRARFALLRFSRRVVRVDVLLADENGPRGGVDKTCRITAKLDGLEPIVVSSIDARTVDAVDQAFGRMGRTVARVLDRWRDPRGPRA
jgi:putative sigma-54 modulation protein